MIWCIRHWLIIFLYIFSIILWCGEYVGFFCICDSDLFIFILQQIFASMLESIGASPSTTPTYHPRKIIDMKIVLSQHIWYNGGLKRFLSAVSCLFCLYIQLEHIIVRSHSYISLDWWMMSGEYRRAVQPWVTGNSYVSIS